MGIHECTWVYMGFIFIIIIYFYQFGTGRRSQKAVKPVGCIHGYT